MTAGMDIRAVSLDLDDTLWPIGPVIERVEQKVDHWLRENCPEVAAAWPIASLRALRDEVASEHPELAHDFGAQRKLTLRRAFAPFKLGEDWINRTYEVYVRVRNEVECYADTTAALASMSARFPLIGITNGTAELERIGLHEHFRFSVCAGEVGVAKPDAGIFRHACERLGVAPENVLHVGDDPLADVVGARAAGMRTVWLNRHGAAWQHDEVVPDLEMADLGVLAAWLDQYANPVPLNSD
jgi:FMN hydrolase / 5-amino-6-(5-phospho-D-ribitylamino)uracil phosphatase